MSDLIRRFWPILLSVLAAVVAGLALDEPAAVLAGFGIGVSGTLAWVALLPGEEEDR